MLKKFLMAVAMTVIGGFASANTWTLDAGNSMVSFGSVKKDKIGETHTFENLSGTVSADGAVNVEIDLTSVQTNIDIRNERFGEFVFKGAKTANLMAKIDMAEMAGIAVGSASVVDVEGKLAFLGASIDVELEMFVLRVSETALLVTTNNMLFVGTEDLGITAGVDKLMELAKLPGITRTTPVVLRLMFNMDQKKAEAAPAAPATEVAFAGDIKAGKKVFKKCKACHKLKEGKNGVGPTLYNIIGAKAGANPDFKYSKAMADSGLTWDAATITEFMKKPKDLIKGTKMSFGGLKKDKDIENLIAYLASK